jgi:hypothetical protein
VSWDKPIADFGRREMPDEFAQLEAILRNRGIPFDKWLLIYDEMASTPGLTRAVYLTRAIVAQYRAGLPSGTERTLPQQTMGAAQRRPGGRPPKVDWDLFWCEIVRLANRPDGLPEERGALQRYMMDFCAQTWGDDAPGESTVRERLAKLDEVLRRAR